jgi:RHS repeat-associated protein
VGSALSADYTASGVRAWKQDSAGNRTYYLYSGVTPVCELDAAGNVKAVNTFGGAGLVSRWTPITPGGSVGTSVYYTFDARGNTAQRTDALGNVLSSHAYDAYGLVQSAGASTASEPFLFGAQAGYYTDNETGLVLCSFRYLDPANGRWLTRDPIGYAGGINLYAYCGNDPINGIDPLGLCNPGQAGISPLGQFLENLHQELFGSRWQGGCDIIHGWIERALDGRTYGLPQCHALASDPLGQMRQATLQAAPYILAGAAIAATDGAIAPLLEGAAAESAGARAFLAYHGTSPSAAASIQANGFRAGLDGTVFFAEEAHTAKYFGGMASSNPVLMMFKMSQKTAEKIGFERGELGIARGAMNPDIPNGSGYELMLEGQAITRFNEAWSNGDIVFRAMRY